MKVVADLHYEKLRQIGALQGANSEVFIANDPAIGRIVAVKEISKAHLTNQGITEYFQEAKLMFAARHPHVVEVIAAADLPNHVVVMMPHYSGGSLADRINTGPLRLREVLRIGHGILHGLGRIHVANFLHLDVKPSNVLFDDRDEPAVSDFGQSRLMDLRGVAVWPRIYRLAMPPEAFTQGGGTVESDIYQVGLTLYRTVNGEPFF
jgi:serine/threonine protein kinase